ncbi:hypothetical protein JCM10207_001290 [Rhodosporidiobolus poonsookiae]
MCNATAALGYGVFVRTATLAFAATAWPSLEPTVRFFDFLAFRQRTGTLQFSSPNRAPQRSALEKVPLEVWELIKQEVIDLELVEAEEKVLQRFAGHCDQYGPTRAPLRWEKPFQWVEYVRCECSWSDMTSALFTLQSDELNRLLAAYHLCLGAARSVPAASPRRQLWDSGSFLCLPQARRAKALKTEDSLLDTYSSGEDPDEMAIVNVSFDLPSDGDARLRRFVDLFRLEALQLVASSTHQGTKQQCLERVKRQDVTGQWQLYTAAA